MFNMFLHVPRCAVVNTHCLLGMEKNKKHLFALLDNDVFP